MREDTNRASRGRLVLALGSSASLLLVFALAGNALRQGCAAPRQWTVMMHVLPTAELAARWRAMREKVQTLVAPARARLAKGNLAGAETLLREAIAVDAHEAQTWLLLAEACERQGKLDKALEAYHALLLPQG
jgi:Tfp pilus assembly protein PilF